VKVTKSLPHLKILDGFDVNMNETFKAENIEEE